MVNDEVSVENLLRGIIVASGNDACIVCEGIAGSKRNLQWLWSKQKKLDENQFSNSSGINDPDNFSTLKDILIMSLS